MLDNMVFVTFESFLNSIRHLLYKICKIKFQMDLFWLVKIQMKYTIMIEYARELLPSRHISIPFHIWGKLFSIFYSHVQFVISFIPWNCFIHVYNIASALVVSNELLIKISKFLKPCKREFPIHVISKHSNVENR